jgi:N-acetylmuramoyl-L-alanine amidase
MLNTVVLDPGHGGTRRLGNATPDGAHFEDGRVEKQVNYALAQRVAHHLGGAQITRGAQDGRSLAERIEAARRQGAAAFVSLHSSVGDGRSEVWVHPRSGPQSLQLAEMIRAQLAPNAGGRSAPVGRGELAVLSPEHHLQATAACLVDLDYFGRYGGRGLANPVALDATAAAIARGVRGHLSRRSPRSQPLTEPQFAPVVSAGAAVGALGYNIVKDVLMNEGDVHYQLTRMEGVYFPARDTNPARWQQYAAPEPYQQYTHEIGTWSENLIGDRISANFTLEWWGNGYAVAAARLTLAGTNDAVGWGLNVETDMMPLPTLFGPTGGPFTIAGLGARLTYRFNRSIGSDLIAREDVRIYGDGDSSRRLQWLQD